MRVKWDHAGKAARGSGFSKCYSFNSQSVLQHIRELMILKWKWLLIEIEVYHWQAQTSSRRKSPNSRWCLQSIIELCGILCGKPHWQWSSRWLNIIHSIPINFEPVPNDKYEVFASLFYQSMDLFIGCWLNKGLWVTGIGWRYCCCFHQWEETFWFRMLFPQRGTLHDIVCEYFYLWKNLLKQGALRCLTVTGTESKSPRL